MKRFPLRAIPPILVLLLSVGFLAYGAAFHTQPVTLEEEIEIDVPGPPLPGMPGELMGPPGAPGFDDPFPPFAPPAFMAKEKQTIFSTVDESEATLIQEVTVGGVTLLAGILQRTYQGDRPSLCPT